MKKILLIGLVLAFLSGCAGSSGPQRLDKVDARDCTKNFLSEGSFLSGTKYTTEAKVKNVTQKDAVIRATRFLTKDGWQIITTDAGSGIVSATQTVSYGNGKTVPLNVVVEQTKKDVNVSLSYTTSGGVTSPVDAVANQFCSIVDAIDKK